MRRWCRFPAPPTLASGGCGAYGEGVEERVGEGCLFCRIVSGEVPSSPVAATEHAYAFEDINPAAPVHVLVVPREHLDSADAIRPEHGDLVAELFTVAQSVARARQVAGSGYRLVLNVGEDALNSVPHLHLHVLGGRRMGWPPG